MDPIRHYNMVIYKLKAIEVVCQTNIYESRGFLVIASNIVIAALQFTVHITESHVRTQWSRSGPAVDDDTGGRN